ncbi:unnamed protein product, partial [Aphanomyces euteiches]
LICLVLFLGLVAAHGGDDHDDDKSTCGSVEEKEDFDQGLLTAAIFIVMGLLPSPSAIETFNDKCLNLSYQGLAMVIVVATETELVLSQTKNPTTEDEKDKSLEAYDPAVTPAGELVDAHAGHHRHRLAATPLEWPKGDNASPCWRGVQS